MFIMSKDRAVIIKPSTLWVNKGADDDTLSIVASNGDKAYILGTYDKEYAREEFEEIFKRLNGKFEEVYKMPTDDDVKKHYEFIKSMNFNDIPF